MNQADKIKEQVEQRLQDQQSGKTFKDIGRVSQTRKERSAYKLITSKILVDLEDDSVMAYNMTKKENVWAEIDIKSEKERGVTSGAAFLKVKIREAVPTRPKDSKTARASYVTFLEEYQLKLYNCTTVSHIQELSEYYKKLDTSNIIGLFINPEFLTASDERKKQIESELKLNKNLYSIFIYGASYLIYKLVNEIFGSRFENILFNRSDASYQIWNSAREKEPITEEESKKLIEIINERENKFIQANEKKMNDYKNYSDNELKEHFKDWNTSPQVLKIWKSNINSFREFAIDYYQRRISKEQGLFKIKKEESKPRGNDWGWFENTEEKKSEEKNSEVREIINTKPPLSYIKRTGGYVINEVTPKQIINTFGFSAVNYGNYVDDKWSKEHTKHFLEAICDLGEMLNIDIKKANQLGKLSIAFGAKGRKGASATYYPQTKDINLTKSNGDGSVAHEWGHYFDNVIVELDSKRATNQFATQGFSIDFELKSLFKELTDFIYNGNPGYTPLLPCKFYAKKPKGDVYVLVRERYGWERKNVEIKETIEETLSAVSSLAVMNQNLYQNQLNVYGYIIDAFGLESYNIPLKLSTSYLYHKTAYRAFAYCYKETNDKTITVAVPRSKYWTSIVELFARSWETVILKKLIDKNRVSNYLVDSIPMEDIISEGYSSPYPSGKELDYLEILIDKIIAAFKKRFDINDFIAPSDFRSDIYIDFKQGESGLTGKGMIIKKEKQENVEVDFVDNGKIIKEVEQSIDVQTKIEEHTSEAEKVVLPEKKLPKNKTVEKDKKVVVKKEVSDKQKKINEILDINLDEIEI